MNVEIGVKVKKKKYEYQTNIRFYSKLLIYLTNTLYLIHLRGVRLSSQ